MFEQNQHRRTAAYDLPAQLGADRSARAGHHDDLFLDAALEQRGPGFDGIAAEQVSDVHFAQFFHLNASAGEVGETRQGAYGDCISREHVDDLVAPFARCGGYGQQDLLGICFLDQPRQPLRPIDRQTRHAAVGQFRVVVDEGQRQHLPTGA